MEFIQSPFIVPPGHFSIVSIITAYGSSKKMREKELQAHQERRVREMEHGRKMKELEQERKRVKQG